MTFGLTPVTGALLALWLSGHTLNVYSQIGLVTLVGLITKHGIFIVEFANQLREEGKSKLEAVVESATLRLRPILMTTGAMKSLSDWFPRAELNGRVSGVGTIPFGVT